MKKLLILIMLICISCIHLLPKSEIFFDFEYYMHQKSEQPSKGKIFIRNVKNSRPEKRGNLDDLQFGSGGASSFKFRDSIDYFIMKVVKDSLESEGYEVVNSLQPDIPVMDIDINDFFLTGYDWYGHKSNLNIKVYNQKSQEPIYSKDFITRSGVYNDSTYIFTFINLRMLNMLYRQIRLAFSDKNFENNIKLGETYKENLCINTEFETLQLNALTGDIADGETIKGISLYNNTLESVPKISDMSQLEYLNVSFNSLKGVEDLAKLTNLKYLYLDYNEIKDIRVLNNLVKLEELSMCDNKLGTLYNMDSLISLKVLLLEGNGIKKLENLNKIVNLEWLNLAKNRISKMESLDNLVNLTYLNFNLNNIRKIEGMEELKKLEVLLLFNNSIKKIENLNHLENLSSLNLEKNVIDKIEGLDGQNKLIQLNLARNDITKIEGLNNLINLEELNLSKNDISKIENLDKLTSLERLNLYGNEEIKKIEGLNNLKKLKVLKLSDNKIKRVENIEQLSSLESLEIDKVFTISPASYDFLKSNNVSVNGLVPDEWMKKDRVRIKD